MRSLVVRVFVTALAVAGLLVLAQGQSYADTVCQVTDPETGICLIYVEVPGTPGDPGDPGDDGPKDTGTGEACYWDGTDQGITKPPPGPVRFRLTGRHHHGSRSGSPVAAPGPARRS